MRDIQNPSPTNKCTSCVSSPTEILPEKKCLDHFSGPSKRILGKHHVGVKHLLEIMVGAHALLKTSEGNTVRHVCVDEFLTVGMVTSHPTFNDGNPYSGYVFTRTWVDIPIP